MVANEHLVETVVLGELDVNVAAVWELLVDGSDQSVNWLCKRIETFDMMRIPHIGAESDSQGRDTRSWCRLIKEW
jgi:hypothetical protein